MKIMKILEFHAIITKIMKNHKIPNKKHENIENHIISYENNENRENHRIPCDNQNFIENHEIHENARIS